MVKPNDTVSTFDPLRDPNPLQYHYRVEADKRHDLLLNITLALIESKRHESVTLVELAKGVRLMVDELLKED
jgi:hypothetical protein